MGVIAVGVATFVGVLIGVIASGDMKNEPVVVEIAAPTTTVAPTTTTTSTTTSTTSTTTTTTMPPAPPKPTKTSLMKKLDQYAPGASDRYTAATISEAGKIACQMWNVPNITRFTVVREILTIFGNDDQETAAALSQAVLWTICPITANFPNGPLPFGNWT